MNRKHVAAGFVLSVLFVATRLSGQTAPTSSAPESDPSVETIIMSPFVVEASEDQDSYAAKATLAGNRIRTDLKDVGSAVSVITAKFLQDTNSTGAESLLVYTTSTEVAGQGGNFLGQGDGAVLTNTNSNNPIQTTRVRGLAQADNTRDFFLSDIPWDSYNVGRIDLQRGPNSVLFGIGSPAGIVNSSLNTASFVDSNKLEFQFGSFGTHRATADFNKELIDNELAVRVSLLRDDTKFRQDPAFEDDKRVFGAIKWDPSFLAKGSNRTSFRANYESGKIRSNLPRTTPPLDAISPWFSMGKPTYSARTVNDVTAGNQLFGSLGNRVWDGVATAFDGGTQGISFPTQLPAWPNFDGNTTGAGVGNGAIKGYRTYDAYANATFPEGDIGAFKAKSLVDADIFDFYNHLLEGPNKREFNNFDAFNAAISQTFLDGKAGAEIVYDRQNVKWGHDALISGDGSVISVDIMNTLIDGTPNPNVGRPLTLANGFGNGTYRAERLREDVRLTVYGEVNFNDILDKDTGVAKILGRHVFTGLLNQQENTGDFRSAKRFFLSKQYLPNSNKAVNNAARDNIFLNYLGPSLSPAIFTKAQGINLTGIQGVIQPQLSSTNVFNNVTNQWERAPLVTINNDLNSKDTLVQPGDAYKNSSKVDSSAVIWQGYLFDGNIVPMVGLRRDKEIAKRKDAADDGNGARILSDPTWSLSGVTGNSEAGTSKTYSIAAHLPKSLQDRMPGNIGLSLYYNKSENFQPDAGRRDILGHSVASPTGETKDYGFAVRMFDDKLTFRVTKYETKVTNATLDSNGIGGQYLIGAVEAWGQAAAYNFKNSISVPASPTAPHSGQAGTVYGISSDGHQVTWRPSGEVASRQILGPDGPDNGTEPDVIGYNYTQAELDATFAKEKASVDAWYATQVPADFQAAWALANYSTTAGQTNFGASGLVVTGDTISKGTEFELLASNVVRGLDVSLNAAKTSAQRQNPGKAYIDWITMRWEQFQGPAGDMRLWGSENDSQIRYGGDPTHTGETARGKFARETMAGYNLFRALEGADAPELRPWRFNIVTNYNFQSDSFLKNTNVGVSYRWQQAAIVGFPVKGAGTLTDPHSFDVDRPYKGSPEAVADMWVGYSRKIGEKVKWRIQLNVRNLLANDELIPVTRQPDGSAGAYRIPEPRTWTITNTISF